MSVGGVPAALRWCWWLLIGCDAVLVGIWIAAGLLLGPLWYYLLLLVVGPLFFGATLLRIGWWFTRGRAAAPWSPGGRGDDGDRGGRNLSGGVVRDSR